MKPTLYYYSDRLHTLNFEYFKSNGYEVKQILEGEYDYITELNDGDVLFVDITRYSDITEFVAEHPRAEWITQKLNPFLKLTFFVYKHHEFIHPTYRKKILNDKNPNHTIFFLTTHLDKQTIFSDLSLQSKCFSFGYVFNPELFIPTNTRSKKFNFFNKAVNLRRLKVFELIKKRGIELKDCYFSFMGLIIYTDFFDLPQFTNSVLWRRYRNANSLKDYKDLKSRGDFDIDIDFIEKFKNEFNSYDNSGIKYEGHGYLIKELMYTVNEYSLDSYLAFIIESSDESKNDLRITEKTVRAWLSKNIFLSLQCNGFNDALRYYGIKTFEDIFGLEVGWDNNKSELERIEIFTDTLEKINNTPIEVIEEIYNRKDVQERLNHNYNMIINALKVENIYLEIEDKIKIKEKNKNRFI